MSMTLADAVNRTGHEVIYRDPVTRNVTERGVIVGIDIPRQMVRVRYGGGDVHLTHPANLTVIAGRSAP